MNNEKALIICTTVLVETSPQALPLGAACVASAIKHKCNQLAQVELKSFSSEDKNIAGLNNKQAGEILANQLAKNNPRIVAFSVYVWNRFILTETARALRTMLPNITLLVGGTEVTANPKSFLKDNLFDYITCGEGEETVSNLVFDILHNNAPKEKIIYSKPCNLEIIESPYLDGTLDAGQYGGALWELARGCPFRCSFCYESKGEKKVRYFSKERLLAELKFFVESGIDQVFVLDPTYNVDKTRALEILRTIERKAPNIFFHFECRPEFIDPKLARAFANISCSLQIGLQSSNEHVLKLVNRPFNKKEFVKNIGLLNETGAVFGFDIIYGLPGETLETFKQTVNFALELYPNHVEIFQLSVLPGTDLADNASQMQINHLKEAPYHVLNTPTFSAKDIEKAKGISFASSVMYTQGRAVPWFLALTKPLNKKPVMILEDFLRFLINKGYKTDNSCKIPFKTIVELQKDFIRDQYTSKNLKHLLRFAFDVIDLNAGVSQYIADGSESRVRLNYHPDDILSPYSQDPKYFVQHAEKFTCTVEISKQAEEATGELYSIIY